MPPPHRPVELSDDACLTSVKYIGPRTERPRNTKNDTEVAHVTLTRTPLSRSKGEGRHAASVGCSSHHLTYIDANSLYATAQSEPLPVDLSTKSPLARGGGIVWRPHYRPHSLFPAAACPVSTAVRRSAH